MTLPQPQPPSPVPLWRNAAEYGAIVAWWALVLWLVRRGTVSGLPLAAIVVAGSWAKTALFSVENLRQLLGAARQNMAHHRFMVLMAVNISQMTLAFALDFHLLWSADAASFSGIPDGRSSAAALFDLFYLSVLNFTFFGFGDIMPQTIAARIVNLTEVVLAFVTVIFLLSDFISLKESLQRNDLTTKGPTP
jgi:hypothetical protein